jgi:glutamate-1-semialdehyde 2,1-aminomutase
MIAGRNDILGVVSPKVRESPNYVYHSGTYNGSTIGLSYSLATLDVLERKRTYTKVMKKTRYLKRGLSEIFGERGINVQLPGLGAMFNLLFTGKEIWCHRDTLTADRLKRAIFDYKMLLNGVYVIPGRRFNMSVVHRNEDLGQTLAVVEEAAGIMAKA